MSKKAKLRGKDLSQLGYRDAAIRSLAMIIVGRAYKYESKETKMDILQKIIEKPEDYLGNPTLAPIAIKIADKKAKREIYEFKDKPFQIYGAEGIEDGAKKQMRQAMSLPITVDGALMPDAHQGYGLPIGGVLATQDAIIPYGVGVDIGCRMCMSIFEARKDFLTKNTDLLKTILTDNTRFGRSTFEDNKRDDDFLDRDEFKDLALLQHLKDKAYRQIGSSGGGNHFVDFGVVVITNENNEFGLPLGEYLAVLSHSGSRGFGAKIANTYTRIAKDKRNLPKEVAHLSWLYMNESEGQEYWMAMNMAGDYASACHHHIHKRISNALGMKSLAMVENHHNFAWKEQLADGRNVFVHRKGATPAKKGELGVIPGSMASPAYIVRGLGAENAINSASHGAGRLFSRRKAKNQFTNKMLREELNRKGVELIGGGLDEAPFAYKNIHDVMSAQQDLVDIVGAFHPKIVRMDESED
ncbi:MAG: RtcB family protein [Aureispira sp.]|nr:RtcB family protein [Aureispira sp.]